MPTFSSGETLRTMLHWSKREQTASLPPSATARCPNCSAEVQAADLRCAACGAPLPASAEFQGAGYEWRTEGTWMGYPLIHIAFGMDARGQPRGAEGMLAIGQKATGAVAIGIVARGFVAIGLIAVGFFSLGIVAIGLLAAVGCNALAPYAIGVVAGGYWAGGMAPWGWKILFSARP